MRGGARGLLLAVLALAGLGALALALPSARSTATGTVRSEGAAERAATLADLRSRVLPSAAGGWVLGDRSSDPAPDRWLLAASALGVDLAPAVAAATETSSGADAELADRAAAALASAVAVAPTGVPDASAVAAATWQAARRRRATGDPGWLGLALHLAIGPAPTAQAALEELRIASGRPTCEDLPVGALPAPGAALVVLLRVLVADGQACDRAASLLRRALEDPAWEAPIAIAEVADLRALVVEGDDELDRAVAARLERWAAPDDGSATDLTLLAEVRRAWTILDRAPTWPLDVRVRLGSIVRAEGQVSDRGLQAPTALDLLGLRLLAHDGLVPTEVVTATARFVAVPADAEDAVAASLIVDGTLPPCGEAAPDPGARPSPLATIARGARAVRAATCAGRPVAAVARETASAPVGRRLFEMIGVVVAACSAAPDALSDGVALDLSDDPFVADPLGLMATALALDPPAACAAMGWS